MRYCAYPLAAMLVASAYLVSLATLRFDFFDMSAFLDADYRVAIGQRPYADFFFNAGPVHRYWYALFISLFGFGQIAIKAYLAFGASIYVGAMYVIARKSGSWPRWLCAIAAAAGGIVFYGPISHPWYDQNAVWPLALALALLELLRPEDLPQRRMLVALACGALVAVSVFTKLNIGAAGVGLIALRMALFAPRLLLYFGSALIAAAALILLSLGSVSGVADFVFHTMLAYNQGQRLADWRKLLLVVGLPSYSLVFVVSVVALLLRGPRTRILMGTNLIFASRGQKRCAGWPKNWVTFRPTRTLPSWPELT